MQFLYCGHISHRKHIPLSLLLSPIAVCTHSTALSSSYAQPSLEAACEWMSVSVLFVGCMLTVFSTHGTTTRMTYTNVTQTLLGGFNMALHSGLAWLDWRGIGFTSNQTNLLSISYDTPLHHMYACMWLTGLSSTVLVWRCFFYSFFSFLFGLWVSLI